MSTFRFITALSKHLTLSTLALLLCAAFSPLHAQVERPFRQFATQKVHKRLLEENAGYSASLAGFETHIKNFGVAGMGHIDTIPVIFHILYAPGQPYPIEAQIQAQLDSLNAGLLSGPETAQPIALEKVQALADLATAPEIFFCLSKASSNGELHEPIHFVETAVPGWGLDDNLKYSSAFGADVQDPGHTLNIWVANLNDGFSGYAQMPGGPLKTDGIVIDTRYFLGGTDTLVNKVYTQGKTLTHLVGSYLGLYELWNEANPCQDDYVDDTPIHNAPNFFPGDIFYHISLCDTTYKTEMIMNFMDNSDDEVLTMFTQGQKNRMKAVLAEGGPMAGLASNSVSCKPVEFHSPDDRAHNQNLKAAPSLSLHPNPATQSIQLELGVPKPGKVLCNIYNMLSQSIWQNDVYLSSNSQTLSIDCSLWSEGKYVLVVIFDSGITLTKQFIVTAR